MFRPINDFSDWNLKIISYNYWLTFVVVISVSSANKAIFELKVVETSAV